MQGITGDRIGLSTRNVAAGSPTSFAIGTCLNPFFPCVLCVLLRPFRFRPAPSLLPAFVTPVISVYRDFPGIRN